VVACPAYNPSKLHTFLRSTDQHLLGAHPLVQAGDGCPQLLQGRHKRVAVFEEAQTKQHMGAMGIEPGPWG
jgi:hypothetical protein